MKDQVLIIILLSIILTLFIWGKLRHDLVAMCGLLGAVVMGIVPAEKAFEGFGHPATVTVALVLILSYAFTRSGAIENIQKIINNAASRPFLHVLCLTFIAVVFSMFVNNIAALAILMPITISSARAVERSPSLVLMPLSFGSILGGLITLVGTPPNIIISSYRATTYGVGFNMFDFAPVGALIAILGALFIALAGFKLIPARIKGDSITEDLFQIGAYVTEVKILKKSALIDKQFKEVEELIKDLDIVIFSLIHEKERFSYPSPNLVLKENDILLLEGSPDTIDKFVSKFDLAILTPEATDKKMLRFPDGNSFEIVVPPRSSLEGRGVKNIKFQKKFQLNLLAVSRQGRPFRGRLKTFKIKAGDVLLVHGNEDQVAELVNTFDLLPLAEREFDIGRKKHDAIIATSCFFGAIVLATLNLLPIQIAFTLAALALIVSKVIPLREIYTKVDWPIIVLLGAMIPIGVAFERTGTNELIVKIFLALSSNLSPWMILALTLVVTMTLSDILNNAATAILMAPIAKLTAEQLAVNPDTFLMAVAIGSSCAFLTPIGHQNNALIMGAGGYKFGDYWRLGLPLEILIILISIPALTFFWPLY